MIDIERYVEFIVKHKMTQEQFTFLYLLYYSTIDKKKAHELVKKYKGWIGVDKMLSDSAREDLITKELIKRTDHTDKFGSFVIADKFLEAFVDLEQAARESWNLYPGFFKEDANAPTYTLKSFDFERYKRLYSKAINLSYYEHKEVMLDLKYGKENRLLKYKIENFVKGQGWLDIRQLRLGQVAPVKKHLQQQDDF